MKKIAIIGAGLSGLTLAQYLKEIADVTIFEKSKNVGGRLATRRRPPYAFDHGAQFFAIRTSAFKAFMQPLIDNQVLAPWHARFAEINPKGIEHQREWNDNNPHYVGIPSMNAIAKYLAQDLQIHLNTCITGLSNHHGWELIGENEQVVARADWVISTIPPQQAQTIIPKSFSHYSTLVTTEMLGCFALMLGFKDLLELPWDAALVRHADISWISQNHTKPERGSANTLVVFSTNDWAQRHITYPLDLGKNHIINEFHRVTGYNTQSVDHIELHRWLYANIGKQPMKLLIDRDNQLAACGDWCQQGRIEAAFLSAKKLADTIIPYIKS